MMILLTVLSLLAMYALAVGCCRSGVRWWHANTSPPGDIKFTASGDCGFVSNWLETVGT